MSSTNRGAERNREDFYRTPHWSVDRLLDRMAFGPAQNVIEPCAGCGDIVVPTQERYPDWTWTMVEKREEEEKALDALARVGDFVHMCDALEDVDDSVDFDLVLTNPPFLWAQEFIDKYMTLAPRSFWLLRLNFLGSKKRRDWLAERRPNIWILPDRPCFGPVKHKKTGKEHLGTDSIEYAWFEFGVEAEGRWELLDLTPREVIVQDLRNRFPRFFRAA